MGFGASDAELKVWSARFKVKKACVGARHEDEALRTTQRFFIIGCTGFLNLGGRVEKVGFQGMAQGFGEVGVLRVGMHV